MEDEEKVVVVNPISDYDSILFEYDDVMMGRRKTYSSYFTSKKHGDKLICRALRYVFEDYLHWTPEQVRDCLTPEIVERMKLRALVSRIPCPPELDPEVDLHFVAWHLYPRTQNISRYELMDKVYYDVLHGNISKWPKGYFSGVTGMIHARAAFLYMAKEYLGGKFTCPEDIYAYFADYGKAKSLLIQYRLGVPLKELYGSPLEYAHESLSKYQRSEKLYQKYLPISQKNEIAYLSRTKGSAFVEEKFAEENEEDVGYDD